MKGIREITMSPDDDKNPKKPWLKTKQPNLPLTDPYYRETYDPYSLNTPNPITTNKTYKYEPTDINDITINMNFKYIDVGLMVEETNETKLANAETKAIELAYDRIEKLLGKNYESKYSISFEAFDDYDSYQVTITLKPTPLHT